MRLAQPIRSLTQPATVLLAALVCLSYGARAETADDIMAEVDAQPSPPAMASDMTMVLIDRNNQQRVRQLSSLRKTVDDGERSLLFFLSPQDVRGTGFLLYDYDEAERADDQWLFLPSLNKSKRIAGSDQSGSFMGSDLSYADMSSRNLNDWTYRLVREDTVGDEPVWLIEAKAVDSDVVERTGYTQSILYVRQSNHTIIRAIHTLEAQGERKLLNVPNWTERDGYWIPTVMQVVSQEGGQTVHRTQLSFDNIDLNPDIREGTFTIQRLEQGL